MYAELTEKSLHAAKVVGLIPISAYKATLLMNDNPMDGKPKIAYYIQGQPHAELVTISLKDAFNL